MRRLQLVVALLLLAACGPGALPMDIGWRGNCGIGVGLGATLHGSPADPRITWATDNHTGQRFELLWPIGYSARFAPDLELLDSSGKVVGHEGDLIVGKCTMGSEDPSIARVEASDIKPPSWRPGDG